MIINLPEEVLNHFEICPRSDNVRGRLDLD
jgi:hypothetical protein